MMYFHIKIKNKVTHELEAACIKLSSVLSDVFGKSGRHIVDGLLIAWIWKRYWKAYLREG
jgi:hypothetical protein